MLAAKRTPHPLRKGLSILFKSLLVLVLLVLAAVAGSLIWLRTDHAAAFLADTAVDLLAGQGLRLELGTVSGPLPGELHITGIRLYDDKGLLFKADALTLQTRLRALLSATLEIPSIRLDAPELVRLPDLPASETPAEPSAGIPVLPVDIILGELAVTDGKLHVTALAPPANGQQDGEAPDKAGLMARDAPAASTSPQAVPQPSPQTPPPQTNDAPLTDPILFFHASAKAALRGSALSTELEAALKDASDQGLSVTLTLGAGVDSFFQTTGAAAGEPAAQAASGRAASDSLSLSITAEEWRDGPLARILALRDLPGYKLSFTGEGPVSDWQGRLSLALDAAVAPSGGAGATPSASVSGTFMRTGANFSLRCATGSFWRDLVVAPSFTLTLDSATQPGANAPPVVATILGQGLTARASVQGSAGNNYAAALSMDSPVARVSLDNLRLFPYEESAATDAPVWRHADGSAAVLGTGISATLSAQLPDPHALAPLLGGSPLPLDELSLESRLQALLGIGFTGIKADGSLGARSGEEQFTAEYAVEAAQEDALLALRAFTLEGLGLHASATGALDTEDGSAKAVAVLRAQDHAAWQELLARLADASGQAGGREFLGGSIQLDAELELPGASGMLPAGALTSGAVVPGQEASGLLRLAATDMRWPSAQLAALLGSSVTASAHLSGGAGVPYSLRLESLEAGLVSASGNASVTPHGPLEARFTALLKDLAPLAPEEGTLSGPLRLECSAGGTVDAPTVDLTVHSAGLTLPQGTLRDVTLRAEAEAALGPEQNHGEGTLALDIGNSPGGPLNLAGRWNLSLPTSSSVTPLPMTASVRDFTLRGAGMEARATLDMTLDAAAPHPEAASSGSAAGMSQAPSPAPPALSGTASLHIRDWSRLAALIGSPLAGLPASVDLSLSHTAGNQSASLKASLPALRMQDAEAPEPAVSLREVSIDASASNLYSALSMDLALRTGSGRAGPLRWSSGTGSVKGASGSGEFALALRREQGASRQTQGRKQAAPRGGRAASNDRLALQGRYDLSKPEIILNTLAMREPRSQTGLELRQPLHISLGDGILISGADLAFQPAGRLTAEAAFSPGTMRLKANLEALPFTVGKLFTDAFLPDGVLAAQADFSMAQGHPQGSFAVQSRISATRSVSGAAPLRTSVAVSGASAPDAASQQGQAARTSGAGDSGAEVFALDLQGSLAAAPGQSAVASSGVRSLPGLLWLRGNGSFGSSRKGAEQREGSIAFQLPLRAAANGLPLPDAAAPLAARVAWNGPVETLWQAVPLPDRYLSGPALFDINVTGTLNAVIPKVSAFLGGVSYRDVPNGILISGIDLEARNTEKGDIHALLAAKDGQSGSLAMEAFVEGLQGKGAPVVKLRGQLDKFRPLHRDDLDIILSGIFGLNGPADTVAVTGDILVQHGELMLSGGLGGSVPVLEVIHKRGDGRDADTGDVTRQPPEATKNGNAEMPPAVAKAPRPQSAAAAVPDEEETLLPQGPSLNIRARVPREFYIRGSGIDSEWAGDLRVKGTLAEPSLVGSLHPVRGYFEFLSRTFAFTGGAITFDGGRDINPLLGLVLTYEGPDITARIRTAGTAKSPRLHMESTPPLPEDEVLAHVLFGKRTSELSRFEAIQLANSMAQLAGGKPLTPDVISGVRKKTGLDMLRIGSSDGADQRATSGQSGEGNLGAPTGTAAEGSTGSPTLEAGKYINDSIYVGVEQGFGDEGTAVRVEVELRPNISLEGKSSATASEIGLGWKMDY